MANEKQAAAPKAAAIKKVAVELSAAEQAEAEKVAVEKAEAEIAAKKLAVEKAEAETAAKKIKEAKKDGKIIFAKASKVFLLKGNSYCFKGQKFTAKEAVKNEALMVALIASGSPSIEEV